MASNLTLVVGVLSSTIRISTPLLLAALGELVAERAGVLNLGLEGMMLMGAFIGFITAFFSGSHLLGVLAAMGAAAGMAGIMAFLSVSLKVNQAVTGMALNLFATGMTLYSFRVLMKALDVQDPPHVELMPIVPLPGLSQIPILGDIFFSQRILTYLAFGLVPLIGLFLYKTHAGLQLRSTGENPQAVDMKGLSVSRIQYGAVLFGGVMAGLGGAFVTLGASERFVPEMTAGRGWLAIVIVIAGNWIPVRVMAATLIFAFLEAFQLQVQGLGIQIPFQFLLALPYILAIGLMMVSRTRSLAPGGLGIPYWRE